MGMLLLVGGALTGCSVSNEDILDFLQAHEHEVSAIEYRLGVPDIVTINAPRVEEINGETQRIQPDGKINLKLVGEVKVVGMTAKELASKLEVLLGRYYMDPKVRVRVTGYNSKVYYVFGQAGAVGPKPYTGNESLMDVVAQAGVSFLSWTSRIKVIRPSPNEADRKELVVDVDRMIKTGDVSANVLIEPGDIVYVPPTPLAWVGLRIRELLFPVSPVLDAYTTPAAVIAAQDVYDNNGQNSNRGAIRTQAINGFR